MWTIAACLLALALGASATASYEPSYGPGYDNGELARLETAAHRTAAEKIFLGERLAMLKDQKLQLFEKLDDLDDRIYNFRNQDYYQDQELLAIAGRIKEKLHILGDLEARVAGAVAVAERVQSSIPILAERIEDLVQSNIDQSALLAEATTFLDDAKAKLEEKLGIATDDSGDEIYTVKNATGSFVELLNTRKCLSGYVNIDINYDTGEGSVYVPLDDSFYGRTPVMFCGLQAFTSKLVPGKTQGYGYADMRQTTAFATDCKASPEQVLLKAFDLSRGDGNMVQSVVVQWKACTFGPLA